MADGEKSTAISVGLWLALIVLSIAVVGIEACGRADGEAKGYAKRVCVERGLEYVSYRDVEGHRFAVCLDNSKTPIFVKVW